MPGAQSQASAGKAASVSPATAPRPTATLRGPGARALVQLRIFTSLFWASGSLLERGDRALPLTSEAQGRGRQEESHWPPFAAGTTTCGSSLRPQDSVEAPPSQAAQLQHCGLSGTFCGGAALGTAGRLAASWSSSAPRQELPCVAATNVYRCEGVPPGDRVTCGLTLLSDTRWLGWPPHWRRSRLVHVIPRTGCLLASRGRTAGLPKAAQPGELEGVSIR